MSSSLLESIFEETFPEGWCIDTLKTLDKAFIKAREHCSPPLFGPTEAHDLRSHYCRAIFETEWRKLSNKYGGVKAESRLNTVRNYSHTWVKAGRIILTASAVASPRNKPRRADFRDVYNDNGQLNLFDQGQITNHLTDKDIYAILLYGPPQAVAPAFVKVAFPSRHWRSYVECIDLLARYSGVISKTVPYAETNQVQEPIIKPIHVSPEEQIQEPQKPRIRLRHRQAGEEGL